MIRFNPDPHANGYEYFPKGAVTGFFPAGQDFQPALEAIHDAGFDQDRVDVFSGKDGADKLDMEGKQHGRWVRMMRALEDTFTDDAYLIHKTEETLRAGGTVITAFTHGKVDERKRLVDIFKDAGGIEPVYWGRWVTETF